MDQIATHPDVREAIEEFKSLHRGEVVGGRSFKAHQFEEAAMYLSRGLNIYHRLDTAGAKERELAGWELMRYVATVPGVLRMQWYIAEATSDGYDIVAYSIHQLLELSKKMSRLEDEDEQWEQLHLAPIYMQIGCYPLIDHHIYGAEILSAIAKSNNPLGGGKMSALYQKYRNLGDNIPLDDFLRELYHVTHGEAWGRWSTDHEKHQAYMKAYKMLSSSMIGGWDSADWYAMQLQMVRLDQMDREERGVHATVRALQKFVPSHEHIFQRVAAGPLAAGQLLEVLPNEAGGWPVKEARHHFAMLDSRVDAAIHPSCDGEGRLRAIFNGLSQGYSLENFWGGVEHADEDMFDVPDYLESVAIKLALGV